MVNDSFPFLYDLCALCGGKISLYPRSQRISRAKKGFCFTLLEIVICIALISFMASAFAWKGSNLVQHYLLRSSAKTLVREIEAAHLLALSYQTDISLKLVNNKGEFSLEWETDEPLLQCRCHNHKLRGVKNVRVDYKDNKTAIAAFSSTSATSCKYIDLEGRGEDGCRIELRQGKPLAIRTIPIEEEEE